MADHHPVFFAGRQQGRTCAAELTLLTRKLEVVAARCSAGTATTADAAFLRDELVAQPWMTYQGADLLQLIAERVNRSGGDAADAAFLTYFAAWARRRIEREVDHG